MTMLFVGKCLKLAADDDDGDDDDGDDDDLQINRKYIRFDSIQIKSIYTYCWFFHFKSRGAGLAKNIVVSRELKKNSRGLFTRSVANWLLLTGKPPSIRNPKFHNSIRFTISDFPLEFELWRVNCISLGIFLEHSQQGWIKS